MKSHFWIALGESWNVSEKLVENAWDYSPWRINNFKLTYRFRLKICQVTPSISIGDFLESRRLEECIHPIRFPLNITVLSQGACAFAQLAVSNISENVSCTSYAPLPTSFPAWMH